MDTKILEFDGLQYELPFFSEYELLGISFYVEDEVWPRLEGMLCKLAVDTKFRIEGTTQALVKSIRYPRDTEPSGTPVKSTWPPALEDRSESWVLKEMGNPLFANDPDSDVIEFMYGYKGGMKEIIDILDMEEFEGCYTRLSWEPVACHPVVSEEF